MDRLFKEPEHCENGVKSTCIIRESRALSNFETASTHSGQPVTCIDPRALDLPVTAQIPFLSINNSIECTGNVALHSLAINKNWENELQDIGLATPSRNAFDWHILSLAEISKQAMNHVGFTISSEDSARSMPAYESSADNILFPGVLWPGPQLFPNDNDINSHIDRVASLKLGPNSQKLKPVPRRIVVTVSVATATGPKRLCALLYSCA